MKKLIITACAASACGLALAIGATQEWVKKYVAEAVSSSSTSADGGQVYTAGAGTNAVVCRVEAPSVYALQATNCTASAVSHGVTNGMYFVWNEPTHSYTNNAATIVATATNFTWKAQTTTTQSFTGYFDFIGLIIQPGFAKEVTK